jgi:hypothetical protein
MESEAGLVVDHKPSSTSASTNTSCSGIKRTEQRRQQGQQQAV